MTGKRGFTLLEILITLVVTELVVSVCLAGIAQGMRFSGEMNRRTETIALCEALLFEIETAGERTDG